ncbi:MAG: APC family permease [Methanobacteriota archaeon]
MPDALTPPAAPMLRRDLGLLEATTIVMGSMIGSGIFFVPNLVASEVPDPLLVIVVWVFAGLLTLAGALTYAELAAMYPESGGQYVYMREMFGRKWAFLNGWSIFLASKSGALAAVAVAFATALGTLTGAAGIATKLVAVGTVVFLTAVNYVGVRFGGRVQDVMTFLKIAAVLGLTAAAFLLPSTGGSAPSFLGEVPSGLALVSAIGVAMLAANFAYDGWYNATQVAEEIRNPRRNVPLAMIGGVLGVMAIYVVVNLAYLHVLGARGVAGVAEDDFVGGAVAEAIGGETGRRLLTAAVLVSTFGTVNAVILTGARIYFAMARDGVFPEAVAGVHPRFATPHRSLVLQAVWGSVLVLSGTFEQLVTYEIFLTFVFVVFTTVGFFHLRRRDPHRPRPYRVPLYPWVPIAFLVFAGLFLANAVLRRPFEAGVGILLTLAGLPLYWWFGREVVEEVVVSPTEDG